MPRLIFGIGRENSENTLLRVSKMKSMILGVVLAVVVAPLAHAGCGTCNKTIVENASSLDGFKTLVAAVKAGGLVDVLSGEGPYTVFAPTDEAFSKLPEGTLESLLKPENKDQLVEILKYHVVPGSVLSTDVVKLEKAKTAAGKAVRVKVADGKVMINKSEVVKADVKSSNGVIHVVNKVLLPPTKKK